MVQNPDVTISIINEDENPDGHVDIYKSIIRDVKLEDIFA
jgi:hypothetical protein